MENDHLFTMNDVKTKWKILRDYFMKIKATRIGTTGSAGGPPSKPWTHEEALQFLLEEEEMEE